MEIHNTNANRNAIVGLPQISRMRGENTLVRDAESATEVGDTATMIMVMIMVEVVSMGAIGQRENSSKLLRNQNDTVHALSAQHISTPLLPQIILSTALVLR